MNLQRTARIVNKNNNKSNNHNYNSNKCLHYYSVVTIFKIILLLCTGHIVYLIGRHYSRLYRRLRNEKRIKNLCETPRRREGQDGDGSNSHNNNNIYNELIFFNQNNNTNNQEPYDQFLNTNHLSLYELPKQYEYLWMNCYVIPYTPACATGKKYRVGGSGTNAGGKWTCDPYNHLVAQYNNNMDNESNDNNNHHQHQQQTNKNNDPCLIYSIGSDGDYDFEDEIDHISKGTCEIHVFDPDPKNERKGTKQKNNIQFHPWALRSSYINTTSNKSTFYRDGNWIQYTFYEIITKLGHENRTIDVFKIDCEGCEYLTIHDWITTTNNNTPSSKTPTIKQILIETHPKYIAPPSTTTTEHTNNNDNSNHLSAIDFFATLIRNNYIPFSKEQSVYDSTLIEWGFIKNEQ